MVTESSEGEGPRREDGRDHVRRFVFEHFAVRGQIVELDVAWRTALATQRYAIPVRETLGQAMAASALLASTLKFDGKLTMQVTSEGPLRLMVVQCRSDLSLRAMAQAASNAREAQTFHQLVTDGRLVLSIETRTSSATRASSPWSDRTSPPAWSTTS